MTINKIFVISEIGLNHNGNMQRAEDQIRASKMAGADAVKFQFYDPDKLLGLDSPYLAYVKTAMLTKKKLESLKITADGLEIEFMCSVFEQSDIAWVNPLVKRHKVATRMNKNVEFINALKATGKSVIVSGNTLPHVHDGPYLYCVAKYPTELLEFQDVPFLPGGYSGFSNHCPLIAPALRYVCQMLKNQVDVNDGRITQGVVEIHTTMSKKLPGCDQSSSWHYQQLARFVSIVRDMEKMSW